MVSLSPKVFEILLVLVRNGGHIVEKDRLMDEVWPDAFVEEGNLNVGISSLRRSLGDTPDGHAYIETIPRRGYRFVASIERIPDEPEEVIVQKRTTTRIVREEEEISMGGDFETAEKIQTAGSRVLTVSPGLKTAPGMGLSKKARMIIYAFAAVVVAGGGLYFGTHTHPLLERISFSENKLLAWNVNGKLAWDYTFSKPLYRGYATENSHLVRFEDLDGDGSQELVVAVPFADRHYDIPRHVVYCFSKSGDLLWTYEPSFKLKFGAQEFDGPWQARDMLVSPGQGPKRVWVAFSHNTWWPSFVVKLDPKGGGELQFVNSGHIVDLDYVENKTGRYVLAAGLNNEYASAMLAVFRDDQSLVASPQTEGSDYELALSKRSSHAQFQWPYRYFTFLPSELFRLWGGAFHSVKEMKITGTEIDIITLEGEDPFVSHGYLAGVYKFAPNFDFMSSAFGDDYWAMHRKLETEGRIGHSADRCPDRIPTNLIREWSPEMGWVVPRVVVTAEARN